jgi:glycerol-3-phosphate dehydrogenase
MARTVEDVLARRTRSLFLDARASIKSCETVARIIAQTRGKDEAWIGNEIQKYSAMASGCLAGQ